MSFQPFSAIYDKLNKKFDESIDKYKAVFHHNNVKMKS
jgi:hypothetical protein